MSKHTPGPLVLKRYDDRNHGIFRVNDVGGKMQVAHVYSEGPALAHIFAAAPRYYAAADKLINLVESGAFDECGWGAKMDAIIDELKEAHYLAATGKDLGND